MIHRESTRAGVVASMTAWAWSARSGDQTDGGISGRIRQRRARWAGDRNQAAGPNIRRRLVITEGIAIALAWAVALTIGDLTGRRDASPWGIAVQTLALTGVGLVGSWALGLYRSRVCALRSATFERQAAVAVLVSSAAWGLAKLSTSEPAVSPVVFGGLLMLAVLMVIRSSFDAWVTLMRRRGDVSRPVVLVGSTAGVEELGQLLASHPEIGYRLRRLPRRLTVDQPPSRGTWLGPHPRRRGRPPRRRHRCDHRGQRHGVAASSTGSSASCTPPGCTCTCRAGSPASGISRVRPPRWPTSRSSTSSPPRCAGGRPGQARHRHRGRVAGAGGHRPDQPVAAIAIKRQRPRAGVVPSGPRRPAAARPS